MAKRTNNHAITKAILARIATEFADGKHQRHIRDLPAEIQFRLDSTWGRALTLANDIRLGKIKPSDGLVETLFDIARIAGSR